MTILLVFFAVLATVLGVSHNVTICKVRDTVDNHDLPQMCNIIIFPSQMAPNGSIEMRFSTIKNRDELKRIFPTSTFLVSIGHTDTATNNMREILNVDANRLNFISSLPKVLQTSNFDGFDIVLTPRNNTSSKDSGYMARMCNWMKNKYNSIFSKNFQTALISSVRDAIGTNKNLTISLRAAQNMSSKCIKNLVKIEKSIDVLIILDEPRPLEVMTIKSFPNRGLTNCSRSVEHDNIKKVNVALFRAAKFPLGKMAVEVSTMCSMLNMISFGNEYGLLGFFINV